MRSAETRGLFYLAILLLSAPVLYAGSSGYTYQYQGNDFTAAVSPYTTSDYLTIDVTLSSALRSTSALTDYSDEVTGWSFNDGVYFTSESPGYTGEQPDFKFGTTDGVVTEWEVSFDTSSGPVSTAIWTNNVDPVNTYDCTTTPAGGILACIGAPSPVQHADNIDDPGTWTSPSSGPPFVSGESSCPEPSTVSMMLFTLILSVGVIRSRRRAVFKT
jgi:hypothetical protein